MSHKKTIIYLGFNGFPLGFAPGERTKLISKALFQEGYRVIIIARKGKHDPLLITLPFKGQIDGINYIFTSGSAYKPASFIKRNLLKIIGGIGEFLYIIKLRLTGKIDFAILYSRNLTLVKYYYFLSKILGFKIIIDYTELATTWNETIWKDYYKEFEKFEKHSPFYIHGAICISGYLQQFVGEINPQLPTLKVPVICDLQKIDMNNMSTGNNKYFLFCGTLFYRDVVKFIINSFEEANCGDTQLYLVVNGSDDDLNDLQCIIDNCSKPDLIKVYSKLDYNDLIGLYKSAMALLIPLRPTLQDIARFPHKIGEYTSSGRPIITTAYGEIALYFTDMENALVASNYSIEDYKAKLEFVANNPDKADYIGSKGRDIAVNFFDYNAIGKQLIPFLETL